MVYQNMCIQYGNTSSLLYRHAYEDYLFCVRLWQQSG